MKLKNKIYAFRKIKWILRKESRTVGSNIEKDRDSLAKTTAERAMG